MKTISSSYKTAQLDDLKIVIREAGDPQTPAVPLLHALKTLMNTITIMTKGVTQIRGSMQFWKDLSTPFTGTPELGGRAICLLLLYQGVFQPSHCRL